MRPFTQVTALEWQPVSVSSLMTRDSSPSSSSSFIRPTADSSIFGALDNNMNSNTYVKEQFVFSLPDGRFIAAASRS
jgi:hypothetical protein